MVPDMCPNLGEGEYYLYGTPEGIRPFGREYGCTAAAVSNHGGATGHYFQPVFVIASPAAATAAGLWRRCRA